ncbi:MAG: cation diffusion facilitator family transporter [Dokdonella sp.]|uniref:cation diffusion facilitator family transporter n=1 Tax=Dokdonella sp. TaxID=2291710 RepID=UPI003F7D2059
MSHSHDHAHHAHADHGHDRDDVHASASKRERRLLIAFALTACTLVGEAAGGWLSGSLALLADAGHMLVDALALLFAWLGARFAQRPPDARRSFGYARLEVLVGYTNALAQFVLVAWIIAEAAGRLLQPTMILSGTMLVVAIGGLLVNALVLRVLHDHDHDDINTASARLHVLGDLLGSLGAVAAALLIRWLGWNWADPAISVLVSVLILGNAWKLLRRSGHILLEGAPTGFDSTNVATVLQESGIGIVDVHHVHLWELSGGRAVATLHARVEPGADTDRAIGTAQRLLRERFGIVHATVQVESADCAGGPCGGARS